jgi:hypothetical protein
VVVPISTHHHDDEAGYCRRYRSISPEAIFGKAAIGETIDNETLGGATTLREISGVTDYAKAFDKDA